MTEHELAEQFQKHRKALVKFAGWRFSSIDEETIDLLYVDLWIPLKDSRFRLDNLKAYLEKSLANRIKNYLRDRMASQDVMDRFLWAEPKEENDEDDLIHDANNPLSLPDLRPGEAAYLEDLCDRVQRAMQHVPPTLAIVGEWYFVDGMNMTDIATRLGCTQQNVSIMIARFRSLFARQYHELCNLEA